jgi:Papain family cysteine protease
MSAIPLRDPTPDTPAPLKRTLVEKPCIPRDQEVGTVATPICDFRASMKALVRAVRSVVLTLSLLIVGEHTSITELSSQTHAADADPFSKAIKLFEAGRYSEAGDLFRKSTVADLVPMTVINPSSWAPHAVSLVGYDERRQAFKLINSWGLRWGDGGFGGINYDTLRAEARGGYLMRVAIALNLAVTRPPAPVARPTPPTA